MIYLELEVEVYDLTGKIRKKKKYIGRFDSYMFIKSDDMSDFNLRKVKFNKKGFRLTETMTISSHEITKKLILNGKRQ